MQNSKLIFSIATAVSPILGVGTACAADLAARPYTKAPIIAPAPVYDWTGFYIGGTSDMAGEETVSPSRRMTLQPLPDR